MRAHGCWKGTLSPPSLGLQPHSALGSPHTWGAPPAMLPLCPATLSPLFRGAELGAASGAGTAPLPAEHGNGTRGTCPRGRVREDTVTSSAPEHPPPSCHEHWGCAGDTHGLREAASLLPTNKVFIFLLRKIDYFFFFLEKSLKRGNDKSRGWNVAGSRFCT